MNASSTMKATHPAALSKSPAAASEPGVQLAEETGTITGTGEAISDKLTCIIRERPGVRLVVAVALGGLAAWIIKRRV